MRTTLRGTTSVKMCFVDNIPQKSDLSKPLLPKTIYFLIPDTIAAGTDHHLPSFCVIHPVYPGSCLIQDTLVIGNFGRAYFLRMLNLLVRNLFNFFLRFVTVFCVIIFV